jgi:hypothetical protein
MFMSYAIETLRAAVALHTVSAPAVEAGLPAGQGKDVSALLIYLLFCILLFMLRSVNTFALGLAGSLGGGLLGFLLRPSEPSVGQLPLEYVISRGAQFEGADQMLMLLAEKSFNMMLTGATIGAAIGAAGGYWILRGRGQSKQS